MEAAELLAENAELFLQLKSSSTFDKRDKNFYQAKDLLICKKIERNLLSLLKRVPGKKLKIIFDSLEQPKAVKLNK